MQQPAQTYEAQLVTPKKAELLKYDKWFIKTREQMIKVWAWVN